MRFVIGLNQKDRIGVRRMFVAASFTALSSLIATTAFAKAPAGGWPPAPDPRGSAAQRAAAQKAAADKAAKEKAAADKAAAEKAAADKAAADKAAADKAAADKAAADKAAAAKVARPAPATVTTPARGANPAAAPTASTGIAVVGPQTATEKKAAKMSADALGPIFRAKRFTLSEKKLREAVRICGPEDCSAPFQARLHRDLGFLYIDGMKRVEDGKDEFTLALTLDPTVILTDTMLSMAVAQAFAETKTLIVGAEPEQPAQAAAAAPAAAPPSASDESKHDDESDSTDSDERVENWVSLSFQADLVFHSQTMNVCARQGSPYRCYDANSQPVFVDPGEYLAGSNQISSSGALLGTMRILAGYDRVVAKNFTVGGRLGTVVAGRGLRLVTDAGFLFYHGEVRVGYWIGSDPFASKGFRPYLYLSGGFGEANGKITVDYLWANNPSVANRAIAWKRSGHTFISPGIGVQYAIAKNHGPSAEIRFMQFFGPSVPVIGFNFGYNVGF